MAARIVEAVSPAADEIVLEVGPGRGALTRLLVARAGLVLAVEIDRELVEWLRTEFPSERLSIIEADILQIDIAALIARTRETRLQLQPRVRVVANLPYYISTAVIVQFIEARLVLKDLTLMLQREVAERIASPPGSREYGALSVLVQLYCQARRLFHVPPGAFRPTPKVDSTVLHLELSETTARAQDEALLMRVVRAAFAQRRKTILNSLKARAGGIDPRLNAGQIASILEAAEIAPNRRAETLSPAEFVRLSDLFFKTLSSGR